VPTIVDRRTSEPKGFSLRIGLTSKGDVIPNWAEGPVRNLLFARTATNLSNSANEP